MAQKKQLALRKQALIQQLAESRGSISNRKTEVQKILSPKTQLAKLSQFSSRQTAKNPKNIVIGSFVLALVTSVFFKRRRKKAKLKKLGFIGKRRKGFSLLGIGLALAKPAIKRALFKQGKNLIVKQLAARSQNASFFQKIRRISGQPQASEAVFKVVSDSTESSTPLSNRGHLE